MYGWGGRFGWGGDWSHYVTYTYGYRNCASDEQMVTMMRPFFRAAPHDVIIPPVQNFANEFMWQDPIGWINERIQECRDYEPV